MPWNRLVSMSIPLLMVAVWATWMGRLEAEVAPSRGSVLMEAMLDQGPPDVVVLGNSMARRGVDPEALTRSLGVDRVTKLTVPGSSAPVWYAVLQRRVASRETAHPSLILVVNTLWYMLHTDMQNDRQRLHLAEQLQGQPDPVITRKVEGGAWQAWWGRIRQRSTAARDGLLDLVKGATIGMIVGSDDPSASLVAQGLAVADPALERVFDGQGAIDMALHGHAMPIAQIAKTRAVRQLPPEDSLIPDLIEAGQALGAKVVFVRVPQRSDCDDDALDASTVRAAIELIQASGAGWLDLSDLPVSDADFKDPVHLGPTGQRAFTAALAEGLQEMGALSDGPLKPAALPLPRARFARKGRKVREPRAVPTANRDGLWSAPLSLLSPVNQETTDALGLPPVPLGVEVDGVLLRRGFAAPSAGSGSYRTAAAGLVFAPRGDAAPKAVDVYTTLGPDTQWLPPGHTLNWWVPREDGLEDVTGAAEVTVIRLRDGTGAPVWKVDGRVAPLTQTARWIEGETTISTGTEPVSVSLTNPGDTWFFVSGLRVQLGDRAGMLTGRRRKPPAMILLDDPVSGPLPPPYAYEGPFWHKRLGAAMLQVPAAAGLSEADVVPALGARCSPVRVAADGVPLTMPHAFGPVIAKEGKGRFALLDGTRLVVSSPGEGDPMAATYTVTLDPERRCGTWRWLYRDAPTTWTADDTQTLLAGANTLSLTGQAMGGQDGSVKVVVRQGGKRRYRGALDVGQLTKGAHLPLERPIAPGEPIEVQLTAAGVHVALSELTLLSIPSSNPVASPPPPSPDPTPVDPTPPQTGLALTGMAGADVLSSASGTVLTLSAPSAQRMCTGVLRVSGPIQVRARVHVEDMATEGKPWMGAYTQTTEVTPKGAPRKIDGKLVQDLHQLPAGSWQDIVHDVSLDAPETVRVCFRFHGASGRLTVADLQVRGAQ